MEIKSMKCDKNIIKEVKLFHVFDDILGYNVLFATNYDFVYGLGANHWGCLGLGHNQPFDTPVIIPELCHKNIQQFFIGGDFALAITEHQGVYGWGCNNGGQGVYGWGCNNGGQVANSEHLEGYLKPRPIHELNGLNITQISCGSYHSLALTGEGCVYGWGYDRYGQVGCGRGGGESSSRSPHSAVPVPKKLHFKHNNNEYKIKSVYCLSYSSFAIAYTGHVFSWGRNYFHNLGHPVAGNVGKPLMIGNLSGVETVCSTGLMTYFLSNEARADFYDQSQLFKELNNLIKIRSDYVVHYLNSWFESDKYYIQMELCADSLRNILLAKRRAFGRQTAAQAMNSVEFFISCQLFKELVECVQYLHSSKPAVIHRNLKPENVLIARTVRNGRYLKLSDFGLASLLDTSIAAANRDALYIAPEVIEGHKYDHKSDLYSVSKIGEQIFDFNLDECLYQSNNRAINTCVTKLQEILLRLGSDDPLDRPDCGRVLDRQCEWSIDEYYVANDANCRHVLSHIRQNECRFFFEYFAAKYEYIVEIMGGQQSAPTPTTHTLGKMFANGNN
ncbi:unnamed protein product [Medioppia subpectinata]|uniref:Protein kinase domain-containing protein n=1 Tax=Medioppia subpectinata TaxID=1979941 RepID=A0A7R9L5H1_9ACAR|nr:unnamed protein product [Medioppia subpectinata]CAG2115699.1 unnamed protein product [Medioppia subpectinata]